MKNMYHKKRNPVISILKMTIKKIFTTIVCE